MEDSYLIHMTLDVASAISTWGDDKTHESLSEQATKEHQYSTGREQSQSMTLLTITYQRKRRRRHEE